MFRKYLTLHSLAALLMVGGVGFTSTSCSQADKQELSAEKDQAYNDLVVFVEQTENKANAAADEVEADYERESAQLKADFDAKVAAVDKYSSDYDEARRQEIDGLRTRYSTAYDRRQATWDARGTGGAMKMGQYYKPTQPAAQLTAANARATYEAFTRDIKKNEERYDLDDWRNINAEWRALDEAYDNVKGDISARDLAEIQKEKLKYAAFKSWDKTQGRAAQGANAVSGAAQDVKAETADERSKVGQAARNTATDVKQAGKKVGGAVKDVFDGKDND
ncbi:DUF6565 domain-containing protein [Hymenobacter glacialis]|uniref:Uncharacterized protein n=1 Tax=Hymenobacter glacialis TaxID=1908236 RepID=A0A1G1SRJ4_9BACT|nr:DUF6565 domain-containing protein [Hymenobacter glacialis]OGX81253.1 hypothetical protein BEN48_06555 [Hymenobacter glacialis]